MFLKPEQTFRILVVVDILVTGGTGFIGSAVVRELTAAGHAVRLLLRPGSSAPVTDPSAEAESPRISTGFGTPLPRYCRVDPWKPGDLEACAAGAEALIHLVGIIAEHGTQTYDRIHDELTARMTTVARAAGISRFLHISALGTRPDAVSRYHQSKWRGEDHVRASGLRWTIFRPSIVYGPRDQFTRFFARFAARSPVVPVIGPGTSLMQPIAVGQVARAFLKALTHPEAIERTYDLCGPERLSFNEVLRRIIVATGRKPRLVHVPVPVARVQAAVLERVWPALLHKPPPLNRDQIVMLGEPNTGDGAAADRDFGLTHSSLDEGLRAYLGPR